MTAYSTRDHPMKHAERVTAVDWQGQAITEGTRIAYTVRIFDPKTTKQHDERREGLVVELWLNHWWGDPNPLPYAEVDEIHGHPDRVWFRRDRVTVSAGYLPTPQPEGALF